MLPLEGVGDDGAQRAAIAALSRAAFVLDDEALARRVVALGSARVDKEPPGVPPRDSFALRIDLARALIVLGEKDKARSLAAPVRDAAKADGFKMHERDAVEVLAAIAAAK